LHPLFFAANKGNILNRISIGIKARLRFILSKTIFWKNNLNTIFN
jgi:hypothetical protein